MNRMQPSVSFLFIFLIYSSPVFGSEQHESEIEIEKLRSQYWDSSSNTESGVVQNRKFTKANRWELGIWGGVNSSDPFLLIRSGGGHLGYHFSEHFAVQAIGFKNWVSASSALTTFEETLGATTNSNRPWSFLGAEFVGSVIYGKLSLMGQSILYYDLHLTVGGGATATESGTNPTWSVGVGQRVFLHQNVSVRLDYRLQSYQETLIEKVITPRLGEVIGTRQVYSNVILLGVDFLLPNWNRTHSEEKK
jgi:outer membrane beta-barrel protein